MRRTGRAALALVVLRNRQHLAALLVVGKALVLNTMRFADEVVPIEDLSLPKGGKGKAASPREVTMATKLVEDMSEDWKPEQYRDTYRDDLMARIHAKIKAGKTHLLTPASEEAAPSGKGAKVIDMMALLKQSIGHRGHAGVRPATRNADLQDDEEEEGDNKPARKKTAAKKASAKKTATKKAATKKAAPKKAAARKAAPAKKRKAA
ncbi:putative DNA repair protein YkoV [compost metagenome]